MGPSLTKDYVNAAGWYFKTLAAQEAGESNVLMALYGRQDKDTEVFTDFLPFFGTDYGLCSLIKPQVRGQNSLHGRSNIRSPGLRFNGAQMIFTRVNSAQLLYICY